MFEEGREMSFEWPRPPEHLHEYGNQIEPASELSDWLRAIYIAEGGPLCHPVHEHLRAADIGCLWTNIEYGDGLYQVAGSAELVRVSGKPWPAARAVDHLCMLFGRIPDFILTFSAPLAIRANNATRLARSEHELLHCGQKLDKEKLPKFDADGKPVWDMRKHDVEEFVLIMERYGVDACAGRSREFVEASKRPPLITGAIMDAVCGTCAGRM
jgi:hypothetical protein